MSLNPEIVAHLAEHPLPPPPVPPEGVPPHVFGRQIMDIALSPFKEYYGQRLPDSK